MIGPDRGKIGNPNDIIRVMNMTDIEKRLLARLIAIDISFEQCNSLIDGLRDLADFIGDARTEEFERKFGL